MQAPARRFGALRTRPAGLPAGGQLAALTQRPAVMPAASTNRRRRGVPALSITPSCDAHPRSSRAAQAPVAPASAPRSAASRLSTARPKAVSTETPRRQHSRPTTPAQAPGGLGGDGHIEGLATVCTAYIAARPPRRRSAGRALRSAARQASAREPASRPCPPRADRGATAVWRCGGGAHQVAAASSRPAPGHGGLFDSPDPYGDELAQAQQLGPDDRRSLRSVLTRSAAARGCGWSGHQAGDAAASQARAKPKPVGRPRRPPRAAALRRQPLDKLGGARRRGSAAHLAGRTIEQRGRDRPCVPSRPMNVDSLIAAPPRTCGSATAGAVATREYYVRRRSATYGLGSP